MQELLFFKPSFFPEIIRDWNALPESIISSAAGSDEI